VRSFQKIYCTILSKKYIARLSVLEVLVDYDFTSSEIPNLEKLQKSEMQHTKRRQLYFEYSCIYDMYKLRCLLNTYYI